MSSAAVVIGDLRVKCKNACFTLQTGSMLLFQDDESNKVFTFDATGTKIWLSRIQTLW